METNKNQATWIWYPGDFEIWLGNKMNNRRTERGAFFPPFWKQDSHFVTVEFSRQLSLSKAETVTIAAEGMFNVKIDGKLLFGMPRQITIPEGKHSLNIKVWNQATPPAIFVDGETIKSDSQWKVTNEDKEWIDESGKASDTSASVYMDAGSWNFNDIAAVPSKFALSREQWQPVSAEKAGQGVLYDFGKETFGYLQLDGIKGEGDIYIYYGESAEEAQDKQFCETLDQLHVSLASITDLATAAVSPRNESYVMSNSKALRFVYIETDGTAAYNAASLQYEFMPETVRAAFECSDDELNRMWQMAEYTMHLTTREFFIDGIKRDRWTWSGDAYQSYLMNYYLYFDSSCVRRTIWQLRGKDPVTAHVNTIMDYTFFWFLSIYEYYLYTADRHFVVQIYPLMKSLMQYVLGRTDENGMVCGREGDWVFVDWADGPMSKRGALAFEQILFCKSLETMALCADIASDEEGAAEYRNLEHSLHEKLMPMFWDEQRKALVHNVEDGKQSRQITKYANMFAIFFDYLSQEQKREVAECVIQNPDIMPITTPYMRFYEMEALCAIGEQDNVMQQMKDYWGGMMREGATTFWEKYVPQEHGTQHLSMYGRPYGKSLCHAWGASPVYLLGKYFLGVRPTKPGYEEFEVRPCLGGLSWMKGKVPTPNGEISLFVDEHCIKVSATEGEGTLIFHAESTPKASVGTPEKDENGAWRIEIPSKQQLIVEF